MRWISLHLLGLALLTLAAYWLCFSADFINYDDPTYVSENPQVRGGLTPAGVKWAFSTFRASNWHPLTWLSLQADAEFFGLNPAGFHVMNVVIHLMNVLLLYQLLLKMTGAVGRSWLVAALFAIHPLHVESVAWVAERKDVLSSLFGLAALWCYACYAHKPSVNRYLAVGACFALSLLAKPMWVTLPALLLLLDYWPLQRSTTAGASISGPASRTWGQLLVEKLPLFAMTVISCSITLLAQRDALRTLAHVSWPTRLTNAVVSVAIYLRQTIWPANLAPFYPYPTADRDWRVIAGCGLVLAGITIAFFRLRRSQPAAIIGWLWFLGTLAPVIGIVQVGGQAHADRYTYVPHIGLFIAFVWLAGDGCHRLGFPKFGKQFASGLLILSGVCLTRMQLGYWQNSEALWRHTVEVTGDNPLALNNLGTALVRQGKLNDAVSYFEQAVQLQPGGAAGQFNLGNALKDLGQPIDAEPHLRECLQIDAGYPGAQQALGVTLAMLGRIDEAIPYLTEAIRQNPEDAAACYNLGTMLANQGEFAAAIPPLESAVALSPGQSSAHSMLAWALYETGDLTSARKHYRESIRIDPNWTDATNRVAWMLATGPDQNARNGRRALQLANRICQATDFRRPDYLDTLAAAYAETEHFSEAVAIIEKAIKLLSDFPAAREQQAALKSRREQYLRHEPYHQRTP